MLSDLKQQKKLFQLTSSLQAILKYFSSLTSWQIFCLIISILLIFNPFIQMAAAKSKDNDKEKSSESNDQVEIYRNDQAKLFFMPAGFSGSYEDIPDINPATDCAVVLESNHIFKCGIKLVRDESSKVIQHFLEFSTAEFSESVIYGDKVYHFLPNNYKPHLSKLSRLMTLHYMHGSIAPFKLMLEWGLDFSLLECKENHSIINALFFIPSSNAYELISLALAKGLSPLFSANGITPLFLAIESHNLMLFDLYLHNIIATTGEYPLNIILDYASKLIQQRDPKNSFMHDIRLNRLYANLLINGQNSGLEDLILESHPVKQAFLKFDSKSTTILHIITRNIKAPRLSILKSALHYTGGIINQKDDTGNTALHYLVQFYNEHTSEDLKDDLITRKACIIYLWQQGASFDIKNNRGVTVRQLIKDKELVEIDNLLERKKPLYVSLQRLVDVLKQHIWQFIYTIAALIVGYVLTKASLFIKKRWQAKQKTILEERHLLNKILDTLNKLSEPILLSTWSFLEEQLSIDMTLSPITTLQYSLNVSYTSLTIDWPAFINQLNSMIITDEFSFTIIDKKIFLTGKLTHHVINHLHKLKKEDFITAFIKSTLEYKQKQIELALKEAESARAKEVKRILIDVQQYFEMTFITPEKIPLITLIESMHGSISNAKDVLTEKNSPNGALKRAAKPFVQYVEQLQTETDNTNVDCYCLANLKKDLLALKLIFEEKFKNISKIVDPHQLSLEVQEFKKKINDMNTRIKNQHNKLLQLSEAFNTAYRKAPKQPARMMQAVTAEFFTRPTTVVAKSSSQPNLKPAAIVAPVAQTPSLFQPKPAAAEPVFISPSGAKPNTIISVPDNIVKKTLQDSLQIYLKEISSILDLAGKEDLMDKNLLSPTITTGFFKQNLIYFSLLYYLTKFIDALLELSKLENILNKQINEARQTLVHLPLDININLMREISHRILQNCSAELIGNPRRLCDDLLPHILPFLSKLAQENLTNNDYYNRIQLTTVKIHSLWQVFRTNYPNQFPKNLVYATIKILIAHIGEYAKKIKSTLTANVFFHKNGDIDCCLRFRKDIIHYHSSDGIDIPESVIGHFLNNKKPNAELVLQELNSLNLTAGISFN